MQKIQNRGFAFITIVIIVALLGGGVYVATKASKKNQAPKNENTAETNNRNNTNNDGALDNKGNGPKNLRAILALGGSQECTFKDTSATTSTEGTVYLSGGSMRGDMTSVSGTTTTRSHMIIKDNTMNMWVDGMAQGFKMTIPSVGAAASSQNSIDLDKEVDIECKSWTMDASKFNLPSGIEFKSITSLTTGFGTGTGLETN